MITTGRVRTSQTPVETEPGGPRSNSPAQGGRRQTTPGPGGLIDKGTKGKRARVIPIIPEIRPLVDRRLDAISDDPMARLFTAPDEMVDRLLSEPRSGARRLGGE